MDWTLEMTTVADDLETRRRRAAYRAAHRGNKEMDWLVGRYAEAKLTTLVDPALAHFEAFLSEQDPLLQKWLLNGEPSEDSPYVALVAEIRSFHGLPAGV